MSDMRAHEFFVIFLKGMLMGFADILPGISGGTIAFITGIYERLILGIKNIDFRFIIFLLRGRLKEAKRSIASIDFEFFVPLLCGIALAFFLLSNVIHLALSEMRSFSYAFFFGLILGSARVIHKQIPVRNKSYAFFLLFGFLFGFFFVALNPLKADHSILTIFFSGFVAISAMLLPGISGAFILLFLGQYEYMLAALKNLELVPIFTFLAGAFFGLITFSRILAYLIKHYRHATLAFLAGLLFGSLRLPLIEVATSSKEELVFLIIVGIAGFSLVFLLERKANHS